MMISVYPSETVLIRGLLSIAAAAMIWLSGSTLSHAQSKEYVVVSIKGSFSGLTLGQILKNGDRIDVPAGVEIKLLSKDGNIQFVRGPDAATVTNDVDNEKGEIALANVSTKLFDDKRFVSVLGGTRTLETGTDIDALFPNGSKSNGWSPALSQFSDYCLKLSDPVLRRSASGQDLKVTVKFDANKHKDITWPHQSVTFNFDGYFKLPQLSVSVNLSDRPMPITIHALDLQGTTAVEQIAWMAARNCHNQALQLLAELGTPVE